MTVQLLNSWVSPGHFIVMQMELQFSQTGENDSDCSAIISPRKAELGPNGVMLVVRDTVRRSGQPFSGDSNGRFVPCPDNDSDDYG